MKLLSINTGLPREIRWHGQSVLTGIFKEPVAGRIPLRKFNLDGDRQADLTVHGGEHKAVYCYPIAHYDYWRRQFPDRNLPMGSFGENFTLESDLEDSIHIGDRFSVGSAEIVVTQPRMPCYKLMIKFGTEDMIERFLASGRSGYYVLVSREGEVGAGDEVRRVARDPNGISVSDVMRLYFSRNYTAEDTATLRRALQIPSLPDGWKDHFQERLEQMSSATAN